MGVEIKRRETSADGRPELISACIVIAEHVDQRVRNNRIITH
jgi:hypothetical protein